MLMPITIDNLKEDYEKLIEATQKAFDAQLVLSALELEKATKWLSLTANPDFKPGRSNLEMAPLLVVTMEAP